MTRSPRCSGPAPPVPARPANSSPHAQALAAAALATRPRYRAAPLYRPPGRALPAAPASATRGPLLAHSPRTYPPTPAITLSLGIMTEDNGACRLNVADQLLMVT